MTKKHKADAGTDAAHPPSFEQDLAEVEAIVERVEAGEIGLEDTLKQYARGVELIARCRAALAKASAEVEDLTKKLESADGEGPSSFPPNA